MSIDPSSLDVPTERTPEQLATDTTFPANPQEAQELASREPRIASVAEVRAAIEALSSADLLRLGNYAAFRIRGLGRKAKGQEGGDLLREAMAATLGGSRRWRLEKITLLTHLLGVMRSLSSHWAEQYAEEEPLLECELHNAAAEAKGPAFPLAQTPTSEPDAERILEARQTLRAIEQHFSGDDLVGKLLLGFREGMTGPEMQQQYGLSKTEYETALKRLRRGVAGLALRQKRDQEEGIRPPAPETVGATARWPGPGTFGVSPRRKEGVNP